MSTRMSSQFFYLSPPPPPPPTVLFIMVVKSSHFWDDTAACGVPSNPSDVMNTWPVWLQTRSLPKVVQKAKKWALNFLEFSPLEGNLHCPFLPTLTGWKVITKALESCIIVKVLNCRAVHNQWRFYPLRVLKPTGTFLHLGPYLC